MPMDNVERAHHAEQALYQYLDSKGEAYDESDPKEILDTEISDLICDLLHHARASGLDPDLAIERALMHFEAEEQDEA